MTCFVIYNDARASNGCFVWPYYPVGLETDDSDAVSAILPPPLQADDESLKAQWVSFKDLEKYDMRAKDLYTLIRRYKRKECLPIPRG
jgi:8-oxo-dGTP pyrophosphatase MutT (NUDIX family)